MEAFDTNVNNNAQFNERLEKLRAFSQSLRGKELQLKQQEKALKQKELQLKLYRKNLLIAIREQLSDNNTYEENVRILQKYRDILEFVAEDIQEDIDEIMG